MDTPDSIRIGGDLAHKYDGSGYVLAAVSLDGTRVIDLVYCRDLDPDFDDNAPLGITALSIADNSLFRAHGEFFDVPGHSTMAFGLVSCWEFLLLQKCDRPALP